VLNAGVCELEIWKSKRYLEWGITFWIGVGLMSIINVAKIVYSQNALSYSWIMFGISIIFIIISASLYLFRKNGRKKRVKKNG
jgi:predicted membrane channel-forming protein YqfA (hemolysin III family)